MTFYPPVHSTTADNSDMNDNFYHIGQGTMSPQTQGSYGTLTASDAAGSLGLSTTTWKTLYCNNVYIDNSITTADKSMWQLLSEETLTDTATSIEFTGLNGDQYEELRIIGYFVAGDINDSNTVFMRLNSNMENKYYSLYQYAKGGTDGGSADLTSLFRVSYISDAEQTSTAYEVFLLDFLIFSKTGKARTVFYKWGVGWSTTVHEIRSYASAWNDSAATITSISLTGNPFGAGSSVMLWGRS